MCTIFFQQMHHFDHLPDVLHLVRMALEKHDLKGLFFSVLTGPFQVVVVANNNGTDWCTKERRLTDKYWTLDLGF
ncbi:uncharacterized protein ASCRUDRAFT_76217 [Ascoidea rubescens DSM 1968]|uniref:Uncharacterized protein n=1 Tax=Ascoidea rubescens DSM 1968 TaxID=1344418 RepID=A0A1D2VGU3_9ASCO|nr:hypothetical protein ASCRUDRAFT_76217 [Ascoidea rubescens DSM 1968]ODV60856.1 hypothetical protein ASCRUDRAFT_76217 [Ascoidea rubescens DSM 1968]